MTRLIWAGLALMLGQAAAAQETVQTDNFLSPRVFKAMDEIHTMIEAEAYDQAAAELDELFENRRLSAFERAMVWRSRGYLAIQRDRLDAAIQAFEEALALEVIEPSAANEMRFNLGQLQLAQDRPEEALVWLEQWRGLVERPTGQAMITLAYAYAQLDRHAEALEAAQAALALDPPGQSSWYSLASAMQMSLEDYAAAAEMLQTAVLYFPSEEELWLRLATVYVEQDQYDRALAVAQLAAERGMIDEDGEHTFLTQLYLNSNLPFAGAEQLSRAIAEEEVEPELDDLELLSSAYVMARERDKAIPPLTEAAEMAEDGELYVRGGQYLMADQRWPEAAEKFRAALDKGGLDDPAEVQLSLGVALIEAGQYDDARQALEQAAEDEEQVERVQGLLAELKDREARARR